MAGHNTARVHVSAFLTDVWVYFHACVCVCDWARYTVVVSCDVQSLNVIQQ